MHVNMHCWVVDECLTETLFGTLGDTRKTLEEWQEGYSWRRPNSALGNLIPMEFLQKRTVDKMAAYRQRFSPKGSAQSWAELRAQARGATLDERLPESGLSLCRFQYRVDGHSN